MADMWDVERGNENYPTNLLDLQDPPKKLYGRGSVEVLRRPSISVIGARRATPYGLAVAEMAGRIAAESDIVLVSGGARGCDSAAARAALDAGGKTVVVSGCGADLVYPKSSADVFSRAVSTGGAVISLDEWGTPPRRYAFPRRNRLIAALSEATMIVEAGLRSGTMSTASIAMDLGRRLYAVPGSILAPESAGANRLIADGASIIASETDLEACITLDFDRMRLFKESPGRACGRLMSAIVASPMRPDELAHRLEESIIEVLRTLSDYEAKGWVTRLRDGRYAASKEFLKLRDRMEETDDDS